MPTDPRYADGHPDDQEPPDPTFRESVAGLTGLRERLIKDLRQHVRSQVLLWQQIPAWALEAAGRKHEMNGKLEVAYAKKAWPICKPGASTATATVAVLCETGEFVSYLRINNKSEIVAVPDALVWDSVLDLDSLNAVFILNGLRLLAREPNEPIGNTSQERENWREKKWQEHKLERPSPQKLAAPKPEAPKPEAPKSDPAK